MIKKLDWLREEQREFLNNGYLDKEESPEQRYQTICDTIQNIVNHYDYVDEYTLGIGKRFEGYFKKGWVSLATPVLKNFGKKDNLPISCNHSVIPDSLSGIYEGLHETGMLAKYGAGTAVNFSDIRPIGSNISTGGTSNSILDWVELYADMISKTAQNRARRGFITAYLSVDHPEIMEFLDIGTHRIPSDKQRFFQTITTAVTLPIGWRDDLKTNPGKKKIFTKILNTRKEAGFPYILDEENCNLGVSKVYLDKGMKIRSANICVKGDTKVLTDKGYIPIIELAGESHNIWNGSEYSLSKVFKTGENQKLLKINTDNGFELDCTYSHIFYVQEGYKRGSGKNKHKIISKKASELNKGDKLIKFNLPIIEGNKSVLYPYTQGFYCGDGSGSEKIGIKSNIRLYGEKKKLASFLSCRKKQVKKGTDSEEDYISETHNDTVTVFVPKDMELNKLFVPDSAYKIKDRLLWLAGLLDSDGTVTKNTHGSETFQIGSVELNFLRDVQLMLQTLGVHSSIREGMEEGYRSLPKNDGTGEYKDYYCKKSYRLLISSIGVHDLKKLGLVTRRLKFQGNKPKRDARYFSKISQVSKLDGLHDTYCFTEPKKHLGMFNGILTGQCNECPEYTDYEKTFACCLSAVNLYYFDNFKDDSDFIFDMNIMLDCVIQEYIDKTANLKGLEKARKFAIEHRAIGLGTTAFHTYLQKSNIAFGSLQSFQKNYEIFNLLRKESDRASKWMARNWGEPEILKGYGERNTSRMAQAPKKSTTFIDGGLHLALSEGIEPHKSNYSEKKLAKIQVTFKNKELEKLLVKKDKNTKEVWDSISDRNGSVQHLDFLTEHEKDVFKIFSEISQSDVIKLASQRQKFIDMGQSINIMIHPDTPAKDLIKLHLMAFEEGVKGLYYQYSINSAQKFSQSLLECSSCEG